jgi:hypothetical protein
MPYGACRERSRVLRDAAWQGCVEARVTEVREIAAMLRAIYAGENIVAAGEAREVSFNRFLGLPSARRRVRALAQAWRQAVG